VLLDRSLRTIEREQITRVSSLADDAYLTADQILSVLGEAGLPADDGLGDAAMGGPLVAIDTAHLFEARVKELDLALNRLDAVRQEAARLPISNPAPGRGISSTFGVGRDPFLGTPALHSGMDFSAPAGFPAKATAAGTVVGAGWNGGYGRMVEIEHGNGLSTRFAHLSRIAVVEGQKVERGDVVGVVGSSGRSTGPHMHYEVRRGGEAVDPLRFIKLGRKLDQFL
jgi:murein DD-endopeptidase MepM/ murein hydrolase activator NlpD